MTTKLLEALTLAEEVLTAARNAVDFGSVYDACGNALAAIREQKAELEKQEPVAYCCGFENTHPDGWIDCKIFRDGEFTTPLYAAPVRTKDLTVSELDAIIEKHYDDEMDLKAMILDGIAAAEREKLTGELINEAQLEVQRAVLAEREACAKVCDDKHDYMCSRAAAAIRAKGEK